ncbi:MAG: translation initiation factor IF-2 [Candidatus Omnitrophica bacterium]|nr:translation initiation factor IF-2 [Candidatus Omnitrophota bacterium]
MRVHELAKTLHLTSKELLSKLKDLRVTTAKASTSTLDADTINRVRKALAVPAVKKPAAASKTTTATKSAAVKKPAAAVATKTAVAKRATAATPSKPATVAKPAGSPARPAAAPVATPEPAARPATSAAVVTAPSAPKPHVAALPVGPSQKLKHEKSAAPALAAKPKPVVAAPVEASAAASAPVVGPKKRLELRFPITVKDLAEQMEVKPADLIKYLMQQKIFASIVHQLNEATATKAAEAFHCEVAPQPTLEEQLLKAAEPDPKKLVSRAPVVTFMGHVDHGKTSLLDAIRKAKVAEKEAGGITQHIGAYEVLLEKGHVTFLDTPGHEAFSALRARGANVTDIVVLVVAADDGVMPQTVEAIDHAKAAGVLIVVAVNKIDKLEANAQKVKQQLSQYGLIGEDWGGKTIMVPVSARTREGIDTLLEMLLLEAELLELKADPTTRAQGTVIEAKQTKDRGPVATLLIQQGILRIGETMVIGRLVGRVRAMTDDRGHRIKEAGPAKPVEVLGLPEVPQAGDKFLVVEDERTAKQLAEARQEQHQQRAIIHPKRITLEELHQRITEGKLKELRLVLKADVQGSLEAIVQSLQKLDTEKDEVQFRILHAGVGDINESDVILSAASDAIIVGFHVGIEPKVQVLAANEGVDVHIYQIIYELVGAIKAAIEGLLEPTIEETFIGRAEVRRLFQVSKSGTVAGCMVTKGSVRRDCVIRVIRGRDRVAETKIASLKRVKDDAREVQEGVECGILLEGSVPVQMGDLLEAWELKKVARKLA